MASFSTTTPSYPIAEFSRIATTSTVEDSTARTGFMATGAFTAAAPLSMGVQALTPGHSAALITAETPEGFLLVGHRASMEEAGAFTEGEGATEAAVTGNLHDHHKHNLRDGE
jgi:hypothetical protein